MGFHCVPVGFVSVGSTCSGSNPEAATGKREGDRITFFHLVEIVSYRRIPAQILSFKTKGYNNFNAPVIFRFDKPSFKTIPLAFFDDHS